MGKIYRSNNLLQFEFVGNYFTRKFYEIFSNIEFISNGVIVKAQDGNTFIEDEIGIIQNNVTQEIVNNSSVLDRYTDAISAIVCAPLAINRILIIVLAILTTNAVNIWSIHVRNADA
mgnify:CR=1 FL=1